MNWLFRLWVVSLLAVAAAPGVTSAAGKPATRIADDLASLATLHVEATARGLVFQSADPFLPAAGDWVTIDAVAAGDPGALAADLKGLGAQHVAIAGHIVSVWLPISAISGSRYFRDPAIRAAALLGGECGPRFHSGRPRYAS